MRRQLIIMLMVWAGLTALAQPFTFLTFEMNGGAKVSVPLSDNLPLGVRDSLLTVGNQEFYLPGLSRMYFSTSDETTAVDCMKTLEGIEIAGMYDLKGRRVSEEKTCGIFIVKFKDGTCKLVRK